MNEGLSDVGCVWLVATKVERQDLYVLLKRMYFLFRSTVANAEADPVLKIRTEINKNTIEASPTSYSRALLLPLFLRQNRDGRTK